MAAPLLGFDGSSRHNDMFGEILSSREVDFCDVVRSELAGVSWARTLLSRVPAREGLSYSFKPLLFELRYAGELHRNALSPEYERTTLGDSSVDFYLNHRGVEWGIELLSVLTSDAVRAATHEAPPFFSIALSTDAKDPRQSEEGEILLAQQKIGEKVWKNGKPTKFDLPSPNRYHMILVDMRGFGITGGDVLDYREILYGHAGLSADVSAFRHYWTMPDGSRQPIFGLFDRRNRQRAASALQERVHFIGFSADDEYAPNSLLRHTLFLGNPWLFRDDSEATAALSQYPLHWQPGST